MDDLKKCPFCGGEARYTYEMPYNYIVCMKCYAASPMINNAYKQRDGKEEAIKAWNRRADDGWIRVEDRLPNVDKTQSQYEQVTVIVATEQSVFPLIYERTIVRKKVVYRWLWPWETIYNFNDITHWRPLPKLPKEEQHE